MGEDRYRRPCWKGENDTIPYWGSSRIFKRDREIGCSKNGDDDDDSIPLI